LQQLTSLVLANNKLEGSLPDSFFTLENLEVLALDDNMLNGDIGQFSVFAKLKAAYLEDNFFVGSMSERLVTAWSSEMVQLDLSRNAINSTIPTGIFAMPKLQMLDLHGNRLHGSIPAIARQGTAPLEVLALHDNDLTGVIPESVMNLAPTLTRLDLSKNSLTTPLPSAIGQLTKLVSLYLGDNNFSAQEFPPFLFSLTSLQELSMKGSEMTGTIPSEIRALSLLRLLDLDMNRFVGTIPHDIGFLDELKFLLLNRNSLSGVLPSTFSRLHSLSKYLMLLCAERDPRTHLIFLAVVVLALQASF
jgi:Leucine-rich repeat (LRR) protein